jgi:hypothetical protein
VRFRAPLQQGFKLPALVTYIEKQFGVKVNGGLD